MFFPVVRYMLLETSGACGCSRNRRSASPVPQLEPKSTLKETIRLEAPATRNNNRGEKHQHQQVVNRHLHQGVAGSPSVR